MIILHTYLLVVLSIGLTLKKHIKMQVLYIGNSVSVILYCMLWGLGYKYSSKYESVIGVIMGATLIIPTLISLILSFPIIIRIVRNVVKYLRDKCKRRRRSDND